MSVKVIIDGAEYEAREGEVLIDVCLRNGIDIPHFCYHPGIGHDGNCRMCQVEFVGPQGNRLGISCNAVVADGMEVLTQSEKVKQARASVMEMLLLNHPMDCPICDKCGDCTLQDYYTAHDLRDGRMDFVRHGKGKAKVIGPTMVLDQQRCVLCGRCSRFLAKIAGDEQLFIAGRAYEAYLTQFPGEEVNNPYSLNTVDICPVGALTSRDFRFASPSWFLKKTPSVCTTCSRGCSMVIQSRENRIERMTPRHNPDINDYWMCDEGRLNYKFVNEKRIERPVCKRDGDAITASLEEALLEVRSGLENAGGPGAVKAAVLVSATCTLEEMYQAKRFARDFLSAPVFVVRHVPDGTEDDILRRADKHPNTRGAELLGLSVLDLIGDGNETAVKAVEDSVGGEGVLFCVGFNYEISPSLEGLAARANKVYCVAACVTALSDRADVVMPGFTFAEKYGLTVNFDGIIQRLDVAIDHEPQYAPTAQAVRNAPGPVTDWRVLEDLMVLLQGEDGGEGLKCIITLRKSIAENESSFSGVDLTKIDERGLRLTG